MALSPTAERELTALDELLLSLGKRSRHHPADYPEAVRTFMDLAERGERLHPDEVRQWFLDRGWSAEDARDLGGEMAETIRIVYRERGWG